MQLLEATISGLCYNQAPLTQRTPSPRSQVVEQTKEVQAATMQELHAQGETIQRIGHNMDEVCSQLLLHLRFYCSYSPSTCPGAL